MNSKSTVATVPAEDLDRAKAFYTEKVGLTPSTEFPGGVNFGDGANELAVYMAGGKSPGTFTQVTFMVDDVASTVADLQSRGVTFEEYDMPNLKTENGIAVDADGSKAAWFKDTEGNVLGVVQGPP